jgi:hypothetical protein
LTKDRFSIQERSELYLKAIESAAFEWLVDFVRSARGDYRERENRLPTSEEDCLVSRQAIEPLTERALGALRTAAAEGSLLSQRSLGHLLYLWREFAGNDPAEVRAWTDILMHNDEALVVLAAAMTSQSWSMGMGGFGSLGDRVATPSLNVQIDEEADVLNILAFRDGLERIREQGRMQPKSLELVAQFLQAWDDKRKGRDNTTS